MTIVYQLGNKLYLNITNACPCSCVFCIRNSTSGVGSAASLWLEREPSLEEIKAAIDSCLSNMYENKTRHSATSTFAPQGTVDEIVFCGYGEPMMRAHDVIALSHHIKGYASLEPACIGTGAACENMLINRRKPALPVRINTNGLVFLMHPGFDVSRLGIVDTVSVSLNADTAEEYQRVTRPIYGAQSFDSVLRFARQAKEYTRVVFSVVDGTLSPQQLENCKKIAEETGVPLRVRGRE